MTGTIGCHSIASVVTAELWVGPGGCPQVPDPPQEAKSAVSKVKMAISHTPRLRHYTQQAHHRHHVRCEFGAKGASLTE